LEFGFKAQLDYRKSSKAKLPVFSLEWVIMQNFENLNKSKFDDASKIISKVNKS